MPKQAPREPLHERIAAIMGSATMSVTEVLYALKEAGDPAPRASVYKVLLKAKHLVNGTSVKRFERLARGRYRCAAPEPRANKAKPNKASLKHSSPSTTAQQRNAELRRLIHFYGILGLREGLDEIERELDG